MSLRVFIYRMSKIIPIIFLSRWYKDKIISQKGLCFEKAAALSTIWAVMARVRLKGSLTQQREVSLDHLKGNLGSCGEGNVPGKSGIAVGKLGTILV